MESPKFHCKVIWLPQSPSFCLHLNERDSNTKLLEGPWSANGAVVDPKNLPKGHHLCFSVSDFDSFVKTLKLDYLLFINRNYKEETSFKTNEAIKLLKVNLKNRVPSPLQADFVEHTIKIDTKGTSLALHWEGNESDVDDSLTYKQLLEKVWEVVFVGYSSEWIFQRIMDCKPKIVVTCNVVNIGKKVLNLKDIVDAALAGFGLFDREFPVVWLLY
ncbi:hypothetical protein L2E82_32217 [Cichorium intybus]|uniref:Uncharacterized protein n=1 Tax=Cichorium intybus TaxID=13427 RepID=A0ACB9BHE8_CICIN|nr:hypothetical protein L2E82_32217 [Cichorium intybus]